MGGGIRPRPYSTDFNINEMTYAATNNTGAISQPHGIGFVWATMLWDLTWALIDKHGMDPDVYNGTGGNNIAMHLVIQGLKLQGCNPGFVDGRDAILQADQLLYNGENTCLIWEVFANRGLGFSADQGSRNSRTDQTEAFDLPPFVGSTYSTETITACESYTWPTNNQEYTTSGSYNAYLLNENGCDSIVTLDLTITASETSTITEVACGSYTWSANNQTYSNSGVYTETLTTVSGCDSIVTLDLTISNSQSSTVTEEVCGSYTWSANSQTYTTSGVYTETLATIEGCDSVVTLDLTISGQAVSTTVTEEVCGSYTWSANNQTYTSSGVYTETLATVEGCDSVVTLDLTINNQSVSTTVTEEVCGSYTWSANNQTYTSSGVYTETLATVEGCDSIVTLDLTISGQAVSTTVTEEVCGSYTWSANSQTYTTSGVYTETLATIEGCDSVVTLDLTISGQAVSTTVTEEVCGSYTWSANNQTYTSSGVYTETLATVEGCDSVVTLDLTINNQSVSTTVTEEVCGSYTWSANNQTYTSSGVYTETLATVEGCDSVVTLDLTISGQAVSTTVTEEVCGSYTWSANNQTNTSSGVYTETLATVEGCDSVVTLDLTISGQAVSTTVTEEVCGSYTWSANNQTYTSSGVYTETLATVEGCDSVVTLDLTINNQSVSTTVTEEVCGSYTWSANNQTYTSSGVYTETLATVEGCDSIVTLDLTINNQSVSTTVTEEVCGSYTWSANNQNYTSSGVYTETLATVEGCDSVVTLDLTIMDIVTDLTIDFENNALVSSPNYSSYQWVNCDENYAPISGEVNSTFTPSSNGNYAVIITNGNCVDTSACMRINILDLYNHEKNSMKIYPNPTGGLVKIEFVEPFSQGKISVYEMTGKLVQEFNIENQKQFQFILEGETGVYIIEHQTALGIVNRQRITKLN